MIIATMSTSQNACENQAITLVEAGHIEITDIYKSMKKKFSRLLIGFSAAQITIGILCIVINGITLGISSPSNYGDYSYFGYGFWTGLVFIITGAFGVAAGKRKKKWLVVSFNVLCIISASLCSYLFTLSVISIEASHRGCHTYNSYTGTSDASACPSLGVFPLKTVFALLEAGCAIESSVVCCTMGACCCDCDCGCCCPPIIPRKLDNGEQPMRMPDRPQLTGMAYYQQPTTIVIYPSQPTYMPGVNQMTMPCANQMTMPGVNQMTIPPGQQQPVILLNPNQEVAQFNPQQVPATSNDQNPEYSGMRSSNGPHVYAELFDRPQQTERNAPPSDQ